MLMICCQDKNLRNPTSKMRNPTSQTIIQDGEQLIAFSQNISRIEEDMKNL
jgi:hypothetical protein